MDDSTMGFILSSFVKLDILVDVCFIRLRRHDK